ncbi:MAG: hypothetical protein JWM80_3562 [Cyanobacteria bacterium RYN_339]|nr:hypothetical protein [Cyanobacteria bacterium RYN_339]
MFLADFAPAEKSAFLALARVMMEIDGDVHEQELAMLRRMAADMELPLADVARREPDEAMACLKDPVSRETALYELIGLAQAEGIYKPEERALVQRCAGAFGIGATELAKMEAYVQRVMGMIQDEMPAGRLGYFFEGFAAQRAPR